ncbi:MAG TPA: FHA domain-containing protein, partial [Kofleriaceae bacterium]|nr:FHA domain-containing protein [Kofleriaceae bacterium]
MSAAAVMSDPLRVEVVAPDGTASAVALPGDGPFAIGRDPGCDLVLGSPDVSRRHAVVARVGGGLFLTDTSINGTAVAGEVVIGRTAAIPPGAAVSVGRYLLRFAPEEAPAALDAAPAALERAPAAPERPDGPRPVEVSAAVRRELHRNLLAHLDLVKL